MPLRIDILTLFPEVFPPILQCSIAGRAADAGAVQYHVHDIRAYADNKHGKVDDRPFGGGPGMVMMCQPLCDCVHAVEALDPTPARRLMLCPQGERLTQPRVEELVNAERLLLIAGHYEGIDERAIELLQPLLISVGDFVVSGGELPALLVVDAVVRLLPGVLGHEQSAEEDSFSISTDGGRLLDCPHYTRPRIYEGREVPEVLLSGHHEAVARWRHEQRLSRTRDRRPDLLAGDSHQRRREDG